MNSYRFKDQFFKIYDCFVNNSDIENLNNNKYNLIQNDEILSEYTMNDVVMLFLNSFYYNEEEIENNNLINFVKYYTKVNFDKKELKKYIITELLKDLKEDDNDEYPEKINYEIFDKDISFEEIKNNYPKISFRYMDQNFYFLSFLYKNYTCIKNLFDNFLDNNVIFEFTEAKNIKSFCDILIDKIGNYYNTTNEYDKIQYLLRFSNDYNKNIVLTNNDDLIIDVISNNKNNYYFCYIILTLYNIHHSNIKLVLNDYLKIIKSHDYYSKFFYIHVYANIFYENNFKVLLSKKSKLFLESNLKKHVEKYL